MSTSWWRPAATVMVALMALSCATGSTETSDGSGADEPTGGSGGAGGGAGGHTGTCAVDCSQIDVPDCLMAVCNEGQHAGVIGECVVVNSPTGEPCDDELFCTIGDSCLDGECIGGPTNDCGTPPPTCREVVCDETAQTCSNVPAANGTACAATDMCQVNATCANGLCLGLPKDCFFSPLKECNTVVCNPASGDCEGTPDASKDGLACNFGDPCELGKACSNGQCTGGTLKDCTHLTKGCVNGTCHPTNGSCVTEAVPAGGECFDAADECNKGECDTNGDCQPDPLPDGTVCNDYDSCTDNDLCTSGACGGTLNPSCTVFFAEQFDSCPAPGWSLNNNWQCGTPSLVGPLTTVSGTGCLATVIDGEYGNNQSWSTTVADSPAIDLSPATEPALSFWMWVDSEGSVYDGFNVKISDDGGATFSLVDTNRPYDLIIAAEPAWGGDLAALGWQLVSADLSAYQGQSIILRFAFRSDTADVAPGVYIDDVVVSESSEVPLAITTASLPNAVQGSAYSSQMSRSGGSSGAQWSITGGSNHAWLSINPASGALSGTPATAGAVSVTIHVEEPSLATNFADQTYNFEVLAPVALPWSDDFDTSCASWTLLPDWQCGTPSSAGPSAAHSGAQCIGTVIAGNYGVDNDWATTIATSPPIDLTSATTPTLSFWMYVNSEACCDGGNVKISTDNGQSFSILGTVTPAYNATIASESAYSGNQSVSGWQQVTADLSSYIGSVVYLQFAFRSDASLTAPGLYVDDVSVTN